MQFDHFVQDVNAAVRGLTAEATYDESQAKGAQRVAWSVRERRVAVALVPPLNVSVALEGGSQPPVTTWYPIDAALVSLVSSRIAGYLSEA
jgi:hypothetical protein